MYATHLRQTTTGQLYPYTDALAELPDMVPCDIDPRETTDASGGDGHARKEDQLRGRMQQRQAELSEVRQRVAREIEQARTELAALNEGQQARLLSFAFGDATAADLTQATARKLTLEALLQDLASIEPLLQREDARLCGSLGNQLRSLERSRRRYEGLKEELEQGFSERRADDLRGYARELDEEADAEGFIQALRLPQAS